MVAVTRVSAKFVVVVIAATTTTTTARSGTEPLVPETTYLCSNNENYLDYDFRKKSGIFCIITGIEHSGTTMVSSLLMNAPNVYGAFELGLLLAPTPQQFNNKKHVNPFFYDGLVASTTEHWWGLTTDQRDEMLQARCLAEQYNLLRKHSPYYKVLTTSWLVDKTPAYYKNLHQIMQRTPDVPFVVTQKDDESMRMSFRKRKMEESSIEKILGTFHEQLDLARKHFPERLYVLNHTALTEDPNRTMEGMFSFLGMQWDPSYLTNDEFNQKGQLFGRPPSPGFNASRSVCNDCVTNPYGESPSRTDILHEQKGTTS